MKYRVYIRKKGTRRWLNLESYNFDSKSQATLHIRGKRSPRYDYKIAASKY